MDSDRKHTACHEAGHAVAFHRLFNNRESGDLTIFPSGGTAGKHQAEALTFDVDTLIEPAEVEERENEALYSCAGYAALIVSGHSEEVASLGCESDFHCAQSNSERSLDIVKDAAVELMKQPENTRAVALIAGELERRETLDGAHVEVLMELLDGKLTRDEYENYLQLLE